MKIKNKSSIFLNSAIIICGPTAVGKTSYAIEVAKYFHTEIISFDSRQCYKELGIAVAKPNKQQLNEVKHHFINSHNIEKDVTAITFEKYALEKAEEVFAKNKILVLVGGTGLYMKSFCEGLDEIPEVDKEIRDLITKQYNVYGLGWLQDQVKNKDVLFWNQAEQQNPQRLMRALEVIQSTGKSILSFQKSEKKERPFNIIKIGLELDRTQLKNRINNRVDVMIENGLIEEAKNLYPKKHLNALQTVGYKELFEYFDGYTTKENAIEQIKTNTRKYAKRQMTWFKKDKEVNWQNMGTECNEFNFTQIKSLIEV